MDVLAITCIVIGILVIVVRVPLIFAPMATLRAYDRVIFSTNGRCRAFGAVIAILALTLLLQSFDDRLLAKLLYAAGWVMAGGALFILVQPRLVRRFWRSMFNFVENSVPASFVLIRGVFGVLGGVALIYLGVYVV